jgi:hypothetical protein
MADLEFSRDDIVSLIEKISTLLPDFNDQELQLLTSIFALAAEYVTPAGEPTAVAPEAVLPEAVAPGQQAGDGPATVDELKQQLLQAYIPGSSFDSITGSDAEAAAFHGIGRHHGIGRTAAPHSSGQHHGLFAIPQGIGRLHGIGRVAKAEPSPAAAEGQPEPEKG